MLEPFRALLYAPSIDAALVTTPPYDVISGAERQRLERLHPYNIISVILAAELPGDEPGRDKYARAAAHLREWIDAGVLVPEDRPRLYAYRTDYSIGGVPGASGGVIGALDLEPVASGGIHPHEHTMPKPRSDRLDLMRTTEANLEPIWLVGGPGVVGPAVAAASQRAALIDFVDPAGVRHRLWPLDEESATAVTGGLNSPLVIADGHHRYAAAVTYRDEMAALHGGGPWDRTMALISDPAEAPPALLAIHRITDLAVSDLPDLIGAASLEPFAGDLASLVRHLESSGPGTVGVADSSGRWTMASQGQLDTAWLAGILEAAGASVTYEHDVEEVAGAVGAGRVAFLLAPIPIQEVVDAALAGRVMPPKSTLFWPKPRTGLVLRDHRLG
jgi:uncharacterized protein (DUF1015 family)